MYRSLVLTLLPFYCYSQQVNLTISNVYTSVDTIPITVSISSKSALLIPEKTEVTETNEAFTFLQEFVEVYDKGTYHPVKFDGYVDYMPSYVLMKTVSVKYHTYDFDLDGISALLKRDKRYRIRFLVYFDKYNNLLSRQSTRWHYFKIL